MLEGEVHETVMSGKTANISQFCEHCWYVSLPEDPLVLRKCLGPSINMGPTIMPNILTLTQEVVHCNTYRPLTPEELVNPVE